MKNDTVKAWAAAFAAVSVLLGSMYVVYSLAKDGMISGDAVLAYMTALGFGALTYLLGADIRAGGSRASERAFQQGADTALATPTTVTIQDTVTK